MRKLIFSINVSLDGFADHTVTLADDELHEFYTDQLNTIDTILFGRVTYQLLQSYWPHAPEDPEITHSMVEFAHKINAMPKIVFSRTLQKADWENTRLARGDMVEEVLKLKQESGKDLSVGGLSMMRTLTNLSLIDEYWLLVQPVLVGSGRRLFEGIKDRFALKLADTKTFHSGVVVLHYVLDRNNKHP
jgi:dihydrofolate reductase